MARTIEISHRTIIFTILVLAASWIFLKISSVITALFIALLLTTALNPVVDRLVSLRVPRGLAILIVYIGLIGTLVAGLTSMVSPLVEQTTNFANRFPALMEQFGGWLEGLGIRGVDGNLVADQISQLGAIPGNLVKFFIFLFSNVLSVLTVLIITFYLLLERKNLDRYMLVLFGGDGEQRAKLFVDKVEARLGGWVRGELILMFVIGLLTYIGLFLLKVPYALPLAIIAGILEILPNIGPIISAIPATLIGLSVSPVLGIATAALYFLIQQLENSLVVPKVMQKAAGVNPIVTILAITIGFELGGTMGAILAVPIVIVCQVVTTDILGFRTFQKTE